MENKNMYNDQNNQTNMQENKDFSVEMYRNETDATKKFNTKILIGIIIFLVLVIGVLIFIKARPCTVTNESEIQAQKNTIESLEEESLAMARDLYLMARDVIGDIYINTERLCGPFIYEYDKKGQVINAEFYRSGNSKFSTYQSLVTYIKTRFSYDLSNTLLNVNTFKNVDGALYCAKSSRTENNRYIGLESIILEKREDEVLSYTVKEKYFAEGEDLTCLSDCNYTYTKNNFVLEYSDGHYLVKEFTLPY